MNIRITNQTQISTAITRLQRQQGTLAKLQEQVGSGSRLNRASDDPSEYFLLNQAKSYSQRFTTDMETMSAATSDLNAGNSALININKMMARAGEIAAEANNGATDDAAANALANELDGLIDAMFRTANERVDGKALFGGTDTAQTPFRVASLDANGRPASIVYEGSEERARALIGPNQTVDTRYTGSEIFQQPGRDVFAAMITLRDHLRNTSLQGAARVTALTNSIQAFQDIRSGISEKMGEQASALANLEALTNRVRDLKERSDGRAVELEGTDYAYAIIQLREQESVFQATLSVTARLMQPSLLDFIR